MVTTSSRGTRSARTAETATLDIRGWSRKEAQVYKPPRARCQRTVFLSKHQCNRASVESPARSRGPLFSVIRRPRLVTTGQLQPEHSLRLSFFCRRLPFVTFLSSSVRGSVRADAYRRVSYKNGAHAPARFGYSILR